MGSWPSKKLTKAVYLPVFLLIFVLITGLLAGTNHALFAITEGVSGYLKSKTSFAWARLEQA